MRIGVVPVPKRLKEIVRRAEEQGWAYDETRDGHPRLSPPPGAVMPGTDTLVHPVTFSKTPSDHRGDRNAVAVLRRSGVELPRK